MQNLRSSPETEPAQQFPIQTVTVWLGNTPKVALENQLQVRDEDFTRAIQDATPEKAAQNSAQLVSVFFRGGSHSMEAENEEPPVCRQIPQNKGFLKVK